MDKNRVAGKMKQAEGKAQDVRGSVTGNIGDNLAGKAKQAAGKVQEEYGKAKDSMRHQANKAR